MIGADPNLENRIEVARNREQIVYIGKAHLKPECPLERAWTKKRY
jgi:hypothetical protein